MDATTHAASHPDGGAGRLALRVAGNALLGVALGLLAYYALTAGTEWVQQRRLGEDATAAGVGSAADELLTVPEGDPLDFAGWAEEDRAYWAGLAAGGVFGRIVAPEMGLDHLLVKGVSPRDLRRGPGWIPYTDPPGPSGMVGVSGHRTTYGAPFRRLDRLEPGDHVDIYSPYRRYRYEVVEQLIVTPDRTDILESTREPMLTMTACHPPYSARYRIAVRSRLVEVRRLHRGKAPVQ